MSSDFALADKRKLVEMARAIVERAQLAGAPVDTDHREAAVGPLPALELQQEFDPRALVEFAADCRNELEATRRQVTRQLDAMLLLLERFEVEFTALQGEIDGLRAEQRYVLQRLDEAEGAVRRGADELVGQVSQKFISYLENIDRAAGELIEGRRQFAAATTALLDKIQG